MAKCAQHAGPGRPPRDCAACREALAQPPAWKGQRPAAIKVPGWPPRWLTEVPEMDRRNGDGLHAKQFIEALCHCTEDSIAASAGDLLKFRPWQDQLVSHLLARRPDGRYRHRQALIGVARKNSKSTMGAGLGLYGLLSDYPNGAQGRDVYSCAGDKEQARIVFGTAKRMIELEPELADVTRVYRDAIEVPATNSVYRVLSAEAFSKEGLNPTLVIFDEVHVQPNRELWDVMANAMGARREPMLVGITTAGVMYDSTGKESLCYTLYQYGQRIVRGEIIDPTFFFAWWEPKKEDADWKSPATWAEANPGLADILSEEDLRGQTGRTPENEFRTKRCNQWVTSSQAWLPQGVWEACAEEYEIPDGAEVVLGFDGSFNNDSTALVVCSIEERPHIEVVEMWERIDSDDPDWRVSIIDVEDAIREACRRWDVREVACDPARWARSFQILDDEGLPMLEFPQRPERMTPATQSFYEAVLNKKLSHNDNPRLNRHVANAVLKRDSRGMRIVKEARDSMRKIDAAVAALMAFARARYLYEEGGLQPLIRRGA